MSKLWKWFQFLLSVLASYRATVGKPQPDPEPTTTAEAEDEAAWERSKAEYERQQAASDEEFWKGDSEK